MSTDTILDHPYVSYGVDNGLATITIRRPEAMNALNSEAVEGLAAAWDRLERSNDRCAVLTGEGEAFCVGADIKDIPTNFRSAVPGLLTPLNKPVVAAVGGYCIGGGYILVQQCDLAIASPEARFRYPEAALGFTGGLVSGSAVRIPTKIAMEFMLLGEWMDAQRAEQYGIVNKVVPTASLLDEATAWGRRISGHAPLVVSAMRDFVAKTLPRSPVEEAAATQAVLETIGRSADKAEGTAAKREGRSPHFRGC